MFVLTDYNEPESAESDMFFNWIAYVCSHEVDFRILFHRETGP